ncbi:MAG TPA: DNA gyrase subunit A, partial [Lacunisphaera sp.]
MAKKKPSKNNDQPELPLGGEAAAGKPETGNLKPEGPGKGKKAAKVKAAPPAEGTPIADSSAVLAPSHESQVSGFRSQVSDGAASAPPAAKRPKGQKVQDEQAPLAQSYRNWFLDYASYVILDRAVPHIDDGLKPVQRRVLHTLWDMDDGRFHKVANVVGATMKL